MSSPRRSFLGFKLQARRPLVVQTPSWDDGASPIAQPARGSGFGETVHTLTAYRPKHWGRDLARLCTHWQRTDRHSSVSVGTSPRIPWPTPSIVHHTYRACMIS
jgi:hypothetical protein